jgi:hypothetical protein
MNPTSTIMVESVTESHAVQLLLTEGDLALLASDPERAMKAIHQRATEMGSVLEGILREPHGEPDWGLNE